VEHVPAVLGNRSQSSSNVAGIGISIGSSSFEDAPYEPPDSPVTSEERG